MKRKKKKNISEAGRALRRYAKPRVYRLVAKQRTRELERQRSDLDEAARYLADHLSHEAAVATGGLACEVRPRLRSVYSLYTRAARALQERVSYGLPDDMPEGRVRGAAVRACTACLLACRCRPARLRSGKVERGVHRSNVGRALVDGCLKAQNRLIGLNSG